MARVRKEAFGVNDGRDVILTAPDVAKWLKLSARQVLRLNIPRLDLGHRCKRYRESDVKAWIQEQVKRKAG